MYAIGGAKASIHGPTESLGKGGRPEGWRRLEKAGGMEGWFQKVGGIYKARTLR